MPPGKSQVSLTELVASEKVQIDGTFLWSVLHQAVSCLVNISNKDDPSWEGGPSLLITPDTLLLYSSGAVLFCTGIADNPASDFCPPEVSVVTSGWTKVAVEKAYEYSLGNTLRHVTGKVKEAQLEDMLSSLTEASPFDRPLLQNVLKTCKAKLSGVKPQLVVGKYVRRMLGRRSTESLSSLASSNFTFSSTSSLNSNISLDNSRPSSRSSFNRRYQRFSVPSKKEWRSVENLLHSKGRVLPALPAVYQRSYSLHGNLSLTGLKRSSSSGSDHSPHGQAPVTSVPETFHLLSSPSPLKTTTSQQLRRRSTDHLPLVSASLEKIDSLRLGGVDTDFVYSPRKEDFLGTSKEDSEQATPTPYKEKEPSSSMQIVDQLRVSPTSDSTRGESPTIQSKESSQSDQISPINTPQRAATPLEGVFIVESPSTSRKTVYLESPSVRRRHKSASSQEESNGKLSPAVGMKLRSMEDDLPAGLTSKEKVTFAGNNTEQSTNWNNTQSDVQGSGGLSFTLWEPSTPPPLPNSPPPLFTPYQPAQDPSMDSDQQSVDEDDLDHTFPSHQGGLPPPLPSSSPPLLTPNKTDEEAHKTVQNWPDPQKKHPSSKDQATRVVVSLFTDSEPSLREEECVQQEAVDGLEASPSSIPHITPDNRDQKGQIEAATDDSSPSLEAEIADESFADDMPEEAFQELSKDVPRKSSIQAVAEHQKTALLGMNDTESSTEVDVSKMGIYSTVYQGPKKVDTERRKSSISRPLPVIPQEDGDSVMEGGYATPADILRMKIAEEGEGEEKEEELAKEGFVTYTVVDKAHRGTKHVEVKILNSNNVNKELEEVKEEDEEGYATVGGGERPSTEEPDYATVQFSDSSMARSTSSGYEQILSDVEESEGPTQDDDMIVSNRQRDKVGWILGPDYTRIKRSTSVTFENRIASGLTEGRRLVNIFLVDGRRFEVMVEHNSLCRDVHDQIVTLLGLEEAYIYGLSVVRGHEDYFLELGRKLSKYAPRGWAKKELSPPHVRTPQDQPPEFVLSFRVQYFVDRAMFRNVSENTRRYMCIQIHKDILRGQMYVPPEKAFRLGAMMRAMEGRQVTDSLRGEGYLPEYVMKGSTKADMLQHLKSCHKMVANLSVEEIRMEYLKDASTLEDYGKIFYILSSSKHESLGSYLTGFSFNGISVYQIKHNQRIFLTDLAWQQIDHIYFKNHKFIIEPHNGKRNIFYAGQCKRARYLWNLVITYHSFSLFMRRRLQQAGSSLDVSHLERDVRLVRLLKHPGEGIGLRVGSNEGGVFVRELYKNGPAEVDGRLEIGDRVLSVNGQNVQTHSQVSDIIRSSEGLVSLLIDKTQDMEKPDLNEVESSVNVSSSRAARNVQLNVQIEPPIPEEEEDGHEPHLPDKLEGPPLPTTELIAGSCDSSFTSEESHPPPEEPLPPPEEPLPLLEESLPSPQESRPPPEEPLPLSEEPLPPAEEPLPPAEEPLPLSEEPLPEIPIPLVDMPKENTPPTLKTSLPSKDLHPPEESQLPSDSSDGLLKNKNGIEKVVKIMRHPEKKTFGIKFQVKGRVGTFIKSLEAGSPAAVVGELKVGQKVKTVNGTPIQGRPLMQVFELMANTGDYAELLVEEPVI